MLNNAAPFDEQCRIVANDHVGPSLYVVELDAPLTARALLPGQFIHMRIPGMDDHILRRPFSVYMADCEKNTIRILYQVVGYGTRVLSELEPGAVVHCLGPVGNGWTAPQDARVLLVGGGVGAAPLYLFAQQCCQEGRGTKVILGAQTQKALVTLDDYKRLEGVQVEAATDDGSFGYAGFCTQPAREAIDSGMYDFVACCGPEPLMKIVAGFAAEANLPCQVSLERRMACGIGACLSCVVDTVDGKKRACVDGPVFNAEEVVW